MPLAFTADSAVLLAAEAGRVRGYRARDGADVGAIEVDNGDGSAGFAVQDAQRRLWLPGPVPQPIALGQAPRCNRVRWCYDSNNLSRTSASRAA